jgi:hypothetical protein
MAADATIPAATVSRITEHDDTGDEETKKFTKAFLDSLAGEGVGWQEEDAQDSVFVVNGEGVDYFFMPNGTMELYGGVNTAAVVRAINSFVGEDPANNQDDDEDPKEGGRKTKRKTRATKKSRKSRATKKRMSRRKLTRRR